MLDEADFRYSITDGIVSLLRKEVEIEYIQHSAEISGGNSGEPLIYEDGTVLGINTLVTFDQNRPGVGVKYYAIGINQAVDELRGRVPELLPRQERNVHARTPRRDPLDGDRTRLRPGHGCAGVAA